MAKIGTKLSNESGKYYVKKNSQWDFLCPWNNLLELDEFQNCEPVGKE